MSLPVTSIFLAILTIIVASFLGVLARAVSRKVFDKLDGFWLDFIMLLVFGIVLLLVKVT